MKKPPAFRQLHQLAALYGVQAAYYDTAHRRRTASAETLAAVLTSLGAGFTSLEGVSSALRERRQQVSRQIVEPVTVLWDGGPGSVLVRLPASAPGGPWAGHLQLASGERRTQVWQGDQLPEVGSEEVEGTRYSLKAAALPAGLPWGYHRLSLEVPGKPPVESLVVSAPAKAYTPVPAGQTPWWGVFLPLYALHTESGWGSGDLSSLEALALWSGGLGSRLVGTLPLLPAFLDEPFEPSPYAPVSRLLWNEFYLDLAKVAGIDRCGPAQDLLARREIRQDIERLRARPQVDYRRAMALKRRVLAEVARDFFAQAPPERLEALGRFRAVHPAVEDYARFRATLDRLRVPWRRWPQRLRDGDLTEGDYDLETKRYHLYAQWQAQQQMEDLAGAAGDKGVRLYLDLPTGVHPDGYDAWRWQDLFVRGAAAGSPPDTFFTRGQDWGFHPFHPEKLRQSRYQYFIAYLRHHLRHAGLLRVDHVLGLHRLFWVPAGMEPAQGCYVRYPAEEFYAILSLESHLHRAGIVGEDLGTVPRYVRSTMARRGLSRMYVVYFNLSPNSARKGLGPVPPGSLACINTHDLPTFAAFTQGSDIEERLELGQQTARGAVRQRKGRRKMVASLGELLLGDGAPAGAAGRQRALLLALLDWLGRSRASFVLVGLEDLWLEAEAQNLPGTGAERANWRRKARYSLDEFSQMPEVVGALQAVDLGRKMAGRERAQKGRPPPIPPTAGPCGTFNSTGEVP